MAFEAQRWRRFSLVVRNTSLTVSGPGKLVVEVKMAWLPLMAPAGLNIQGADGISFTVQGGVSMVTCSACAPRVLLLVQVAASS